MEPSERRATPCSRSVVSGLLMKSPTLPDVPIVVSITDLPKLSFSSMSLYAVSCKALFIVPNYLPARLSA